MTKWLIAVLIITSLPYHNIGATKYAGEFLTLGMGARAAGLGGAYCSVVDDASAPYWNPAGIALADKREVLLMHSEVFGGIITYDCLGFALPTQNSGFGVNFFRLAIQDIPLTGDLEFEDWGIDGIPETGDEGEGNGEFDPGELLIYDVNRIQRVTNSDMALFLSYGWSFPNGLAIGAGVKGIRREIGSYSAYGSGADLGVIYRPTENFALAFNLQDFTTTFISWNNGTWEKVLPTLKLGVSSRHSVEQLQGRILLSIDQDVRFEGREETSQFSVGRVSDDFRLGAEYTYNEVVSVRLGLEYGQLTAGMGVVYRNYMVDYAFLSHPDLQGSYRLSAAAVF